LSDLINGSRYTAATTTGRGAMAYYYRLYNTYIRHCNYLLPYTVTHIEMHRNTVGYGASVVVTMATISA